MPVPARLLREICRARRPGRKDSRKDTVQLPDWRRGLGVGGGGGGGEAAPERPRNQPCKQARGQVTSSTDTSPQPRVWYYCSAGQTQRDVPSAWSVGSWVLSKCTPRRPGSKHDQRIYMFFSHDVQPVRAPELLSFATAAVPKVIPTDVTVPGFGALWNGAFGDEHCCILERLRKKPRQVCPPVRPIGAADAIQPDSRDQDNTKAGAIFREYPLIYSVSSAAASPVAHRGWQNRPLWFHRDNAGGIDVRWRF